MAQFKVKKLDSIGRKGRDRRYYDANDKIEEPTK